jgi:Dyp-type peroxidase family
MNNVEDFLEFEDLQGLLRFAHARLTEACFLLLKVLNPHAARQWLNSAPVTDAKIRDSAPDNALQIAFSVEGLRVLGLDERIIEGFSDEFIVGMAGDESRSRRLGDSGESAPSQWSWGGDTTATPHILLLHYTVPGGLERQRASLENDRFNTAFERLAILTTQDLDGLEHFGFADGISQPKIDWSQRQSTDLHERDRYSNRLALGETVLGYVNEYGLYTDRPLIDPARDNLAAILPEAEDNPGMKDFARNGCYLVFRQLSQDVTGFWRFIDQQCGSHGQRREALAATMVGRGRDGTPLIKRHGDHRNQFTYDTDPRGRECPLGAHIRRSNPRSGDFPPGVNGFFSRLLKAFGFNQRRPDEDLVASSRFHRLLRRGRPYGPPLSPHEALETEAAKAERGLHFICLVANISRQFEFVQNTWSMSSKFNGMLQESDPLLGRREPLVNGQSTDCFTLASLDGASHKVCGLPAFVSVRGGGYFFMPGMRALRYIASLLPADGGERR